MPLSQSGDCELARRSLERGRSTWNVGYYNFVDYLFGLAEVWLLLSEGRAVEACELARKTEDEMHRHGHARFKLPRTRVRETCLWAKLVHAIATNDVGDAPTPREIRRLRRSGVPTFTTTALILSAGRASLLGQHDRERELWRQAVHEYDAKSMHAYAAASRWRLAALGVEDAEPLEAQARAYFEREKIADVPRFVDLMAPARRELSRPAPGQT